MTSGDTGLTTVVDAHPRLWCEFVLWGLCAKRHTEAPMRVYFVGSPPPGILRFVEAQGIDTRFATTLLAGSPHCNKLLPFLDEQGFENQIVTDSDVFILGDLAALLQPGAVRLAPNNHGNPPLSVFADLVAVRGLAPPEPGLALFPAGDGFRETFVGNVSAGVIAIPARHRGFAEHWADSARWLLRNADLMGCYKVHTDQIAFSLAALEQALPFVFLPPQANAILQLLPEIQTVIALHLTSGHIPQYPKWFNADKTLRIAEINPVLEPALQVFNELVAEAVAAIALIPELAAFSENFLNPAYRR